MLGEALRLIRVFHDLKQFEVAERLGVSRSHISDIEKGNREPSLDLIRKYSKEFGVSPSEIMFFAEGVGSANRGERARTSIASKVIDMLRFIEMKAQA
ncbi:helix-turn-helix transcriptional regulator [Qipengyuania sp. Mu-71]|jgi:transcriptional regulator with XRE-family HTH domain|uniref:helix-turn-helix transcriptional regulator n=1 Tax=Qipengyuania sp. Mu-71 TaxID=3121477 RepID=UPI002FE47E3A